MHRKVWDENWCSHETVSCSAGQPPVWRAAALYHKCFSSLSMSNSVNNTIPRLQAHVWVGSNSQLSRLGLIQKVCLKRSTSSSNSNRAARLDECCPSIAWLCGRGLLSLYDEKHRCPLHHKERFWKKPSKGWEGTDGRTFKPWQRELSMGCHRQRALMKSSNSPICLCFVFLSFRDSNYSNCRRGFAGYVAEWLIFTYIYFFQWVEWRWAKPWSSRRPA